MCGASGLGDALGLEGTRRLSFSPVEISKVLNLLLRMMILGSVKTCSFEDIVEDDDSTYVF